MLRHEPFLEEAARRGASHPLGQDPLVGYLSLHAVDHALQFGPESVPARQVADKVLTEVLLLPDDSACKKPYFWMVDSVRRGASWETISVRLSQLADHLEREGRYGEAEDVFATLVEIQELPGVAAQCGESSVVAALLGRARTLRKQAEFDGSERWYRKAEERARAASLPDQEVSARVGFARMTMERGNYPKAQKILDEIHRDFVDVTLTPHARGSIFHEMALAARATDRTHALRLLWEAFAAYREPADRELSLHDIGVELLQMGVYADARKAFEVLERHGSAEVCRYALGSLLEIAWRTRDRVLFRRVWGKISGHLDALRPTVRAEAYLFAGQALRAFGKEDDGRALLEEAKDVARAFELNEVLVRADQYLAQPEEEITPPARRADGAILTVSEAVDSLWRSDSLVPV